MSAPDWGTPPPRWGAGPSPWRSRREWRRAERGFDPGRVYRDTERGWIAGVCAGIADYMGVDPLPVRLAAVLLLVFFFVPTLVSYAAFAIILRPKPPAAFASPEQEALWRRLRTEPAAVLGRLAARLRGIDGRIRRIETLVTSDEFELRRGFRDLGG
ncbi:MAG TPA: envelope stress response membrane protein PspC [Acetobacteraceae bacterium]|nr:envelope stress response membrane protein PspC [Acetobacteraceae bacterium]